MSPTNVSDELAGVLFPFQALHRMAVRRFLDAGGSSAWTEILVQLHYATSMSAPLLLNAAERARSIGDSRHQTFVTWCEEHAEEEAPHGAWILDDLETIGLSKETVERGLAHDTVLKLIGSQFMIARSNHPMAILGYVYASECHPGTVAGIEDMADRYDMAKSALKTIFFHADEDVEHAREIRRMLELTQPHEFEHVKTSALLYLNGWTAFYREALGSVRPQESEVLGA
jgi:hypothetical protein